MKAIQVTTWGESPTFNASAPDLPSPAEGEIQLRILGSGLHRLVRAQASGTHYSARQLPLPYTPGADGVGQSSDGKNYYFISIANGGGFAESINMPKARLIELSPGADPIQIAALVNPGMSSWMAIKARVKDHDLSKPWTVVILGVTTQSGKVAVDFARSLGATRVVGVARDEAKMKALDLDEIIVLKEDPFETAFEKMGDVHVILDYLYGAPFTACLAKLDSKVPTQAVQIGSMSGVDAEIPSALLRSKDVTMRGSGPGAWSMEMFGAEVKGLVRAVEKLPKQAVVVRGLGEVGEGFADERGRTVFVPGK